MNKHRSCFSKSKLKIEWAAAIILKEKNNGLHLHAYKCAHCSYFHLSKLSKIEADIKRQGHTLRELLAA